MAFIPLIWCYPRFRNKPASSVSSVIQKSCLLVGRSELATSDMSDLNGGAMSEVAHARSDGQEGSHNARRDLEVAPTGSHVRDLEVAPTGSHVRDLEVAPTGHHVRDLEVAPTGNTRFRQSIDIH